MAAGGEPADPEVTRLSEAQDHRDLWDREHHDARVAARVAQQELTRRGVEAEQLQTGDSDLDLEADVEREAEQETAREPGGQRHADQGSPEEKAEADARWFNEQVTEMERAIDADTPAAVNHNEDAAWQAERAARSERSTQARAELARQAAGGETVSEWDVASTYLQTAEAGPAAQAEIDADNERWLEELLATMEREEAAAATEAETGAEANAEAPGEPVTQPVAEAGPALPTPAGSFRQSPSPR